MTDTLAQNISPEAQAVRVDARLYKDQHNEDAGEVVFSVPETGFALHAKEKNGKLILLDMGPLSADRTSIRNGIATAERAIKYAADNQLRGLVDPYICEAGVPVVRRLIEMGHDIRLLDHPRGHSPSIEVATTENSFTPFEFDW